MARVKRSVHGRKHHRAVLEQAKGYYGNKSRTYRSANEQLMHSMQYAFRDRRARKGDFRKLWIQRINAGARLHGLSYSRLINGLHLAGIEVDRKVLADLAVTDPEAFGALVRAAQDALPAPQGNRRGRFLLSQPLAFTHRRVRRLRSLLQKRSTRWSERVFVAEGAELLRTALRAGRGDRVRVSRPRGREDPPTRETCQQALETGARLFILGPGRARAGGRHRHATARSDHPPHVARDGPGRGRWPATTSAAEQPLLVVLVDVRDPGNAGTVLRTADAAGVDAVIFSGESVDPYNPKTVRASAGSLFHVPFSVQADPVALAASLGARGYRTLATVARDGDDYAALDWSVPTVLFLGNEAAGLGPEVRRAVGGAVAIPMDGRAESLNVGVACAVLCFEALRQRRLRGAGAAPSTISV